MRALNLIYFSFFILHFSFAQQPWQVPAEKSSVTAPFKFDAATQEAGKTLYMKNCKSCHGDPGKGNFSKLNPLPNDPATDRFGKQKDGDLFYKITSGRGLMPRFEQTLTIEQRWQVISFLRTFHKGYVQPAIQEKKKGTGDELVLSIKKQNDSIIIVHADKILQKDTVPAAGVAMQLFVVRYFGKLAIDETRNTDAAGTIRFHVHPDFPADTSNRIEFFTRPENVDVYGDVSASATLFFGSKNNKPALNEQRAMWNVLSKAPWWILLTYVIGVLAIWSVIVYIVFQLIKLLTNKTN